MKPLPIEDPTPFTIPGYRLSRDHADLDFDVVHGFLTEAYWSEGISRDEVEIAHRHSLTIACLTEPEGPEAPSVQVGGARLVTDRVAFAYLADVFVVPEHRRRGLARWIVAAALAHPDLGGNVRRFMLFTRDAHPIYRSFGFEIPDAIPTNMMVRPGPGYRPVPAAMTEQVGG